MRVIPSLAALAVIGGAAAWWLTAPSPLPPVATAGLTGNPQAGEQVFWTAGCASCHMAAEAKGAAQLLLTGGQAFPSPFGTFKAPNISPSPQGIGGWTLAQFADAVTRGVSPEGAHYYPAFPYASYARMELQDVADLKAFMDTLPPSDAASQPHEIGFPFNIRRSLGGWKLLFFREDWVIPDPLDDQAARGRYIVEALAHCGECHTPRNALGGLETGRWLAGAPNPSGQGSIPNITPAKLGWSEAEIVEYLTTGFTPEFDSVGGHMAHVVENMARLPQAEREAVAAYLKQVPAVE